MYFEYNGNSYPIEIIRKNNKNLYIRVSDNMIIIITCPWLYTKLYIKKIIQENERSIKKMIDKQLIKKSNNEFEANCFLGNKLAIVYKEVKKPVYDGTTLTISDDKMLDKWYKTMAMEVFKEHLDKIYSLFEENIPYPTIKIRIMKTRWGVCNRMSNTVSLNFDLIKKDTKYLDYVIVHELSHFVHFNHSRDFWQEVAKYCPNYKVIRRELKD